MHIRELPSGRQRWIVQFKGQRRSGTEAGRPQAILAASRALVELGDAHPASVNATVEDLLTAWQDEHGDDWSPTYRVDVAHVLQHLPRAFLERDIQGVEPAVVATLQRTLLRQGWSPHRIQRVRGCISGAYRMAVDYGWTNRNPVADVRAPKVERADVTAPELDMVRRILDTAPVTIVLFLRLAAITGARRGELVGLQWRDLDGSDLSIRRAVVQVAGSGPVVRGTKTGRKGERKLELDAETLELLDKLREAQRSNATERMLPVPVFIFSHDAGVSPWRPDYITQAYGKYRRTIPGARSVRLHDLRHWVATDMLQRGTPLIDVAGQLGHSNPRTTAAVYAHVMPGRGGDAARDRASRLGGGG
jgi:integrase